MCTACLRIIDLHVDAHYVQYALVIYFMKDVRDNAMIRTVLRMGTAVWGVAHESLLGIDRLSGAVKCQSLVNSVREGLHGHSHALGVDAFGMRSPYQSFDLLMRLRKITCHFSSFRSLLCWCRWVC